MKKTETKENFTDSSPVIYQTSDIAVSAFLLAKGYKLEEVERSSVKLLFRFVETDELKTQIRNFWDYKETVCPLTYYQKLRELKMIIHSGIK